MLVVSDALKNAFMQEDRRILIRLTIGSRVFDNNNVFNVEYDSGSLAGEVFAIGSTYANSIKVTFSELVEGLNELDEVVYEIGIEMPDGTISYVPMGTFIINSTIEMDRNNYKTTIECMDKMVMMGGNYVSTLTYPAEIRAVALEIANKAGVLVDSTSFARLTADKIAKPEGYTFRDAIGLIAQFEAGYATFNRFGKLEIRTLTDPNFSIPPENYFSKGLTKNEVFFRLGGISCTSESSDVTFQSGATTGNQIVLENRVMTKALLDKIYTKVQTINYYPFSLSWRGNPVLEAGDWIEVEDLQGNVFKTPNINYSLSFSGGLTAKSSADTKTQSDAVYNYKSPLQQKIDWIHARIDAAGGNVIYEGIDEPLSPKEGDLWFKIIGPDKEINIYMKDAEGVLSWVPQISTADIDKLAKEIIAVMELIEADKLETEQAINQSLLDAKNYVDQQTALWDSQYATDTTAIRNEITTGYNQAITNSKNYTDTKASEFDSNLTLVKADVATTVTKANEAITKANQAVEDVGFLKPDVATAKSNAATALSNSNTAVSNAALAITNSNTAISNAQTALNRVGLVEEVNEGLQTSFDTLTNTVTLKADKSVVDGLKGTVTTQGTSITANSTAIALKADKSIVDTINGTVNTHTTQIKATSDSLLLKADSSLVNTIKGTVDTHTTQIKVVSDGLELKAESSLVNTINGTVSTHTGQIAANSTAIGLRLTSAQVESAITSKNYVNQTTLNATSSGLTAQITQVSADLSNISVGGTNLLKNSKNNGNVTEKYGDFNVMYGLSTTTAYKDTYSFTTPVLNGLEYTVSFFAKSSAASSFKNHFYSPNTTISGVTSSGNTTTSSDGGIDLSVTTEWKRYWITWKQSSSGSTKSVIIGRVTNGNDVFIAGVKFESGNKNSDWSPAPEDMATLEKVVTIEANIDGINTLVASKASQTQVTQLANQITTKVESATYNSKMTQLDSAINLRVVQSDVTAAILEDKTIKDTRNDNQLPNWYLANYPKQVVEELKLRSVMGVPLPGSAYGQLTTNVTWSDTGTGGFVQTFRASDGVFQRSSNAATNTWGTWDKIAETGKLISQINISTEGILLQGKRIQLDGDVAMNAAFITRLDTQTLTAVTANIATIRTSMLTADVITSVHLKVDNAMMDKLTATTAVVNYLFTKTAFVDNLNAKTLTAITANIATIRSQVLVANVVQATHLLGDTATITKLFATDANVNMLTAKTAFINSVKAIDISADRITTGSLNAASVNIINLNVSSLTGNLTQFVKTNWDLQNTSISIDATGLKSISGSMSTVLNAGTITNSNGTKTGTINALGMQIADSSNGWTTRLYSDGLEFQWYGVIRGITQTSEGLEIKPTTGSGARLNSSLFLTTGPGNDKIAYLQLTNPDGGTNTRLEMNGTQLSLRHPNGGSLDIADYAYNGQLGRINSGKFRTVTTDGRGIQMEVSQISALAGNQTIYIMPSGSGELRIGNGSANPTLWPIRAASFVQGSSRASKTNIVAFKGNALDTLDQLNIVTFNRRDELSRGVIYESIGVIAEDSPSIMAHQSPGDPAGVDNYKMVSLTIKGVQELNRTVKMNTNKLNEQDKRIFDLEKENKEIKQTLASLVGV